MERSTNDNVNSGPSYQNCNLTSVLQHPTAAFKTDAGSSTSQTQPTYFPTGRSGLVRYCGVCGDIAKSYHFGGLSCDSCKAFFRRSVQNDSYLQFQCCLYNGQCVITISSRKSCQYCRMNRCFSIGMEKSWVMTEDERKALMKARADKKLRKQLAASASNTTTGIRYLFDFPSDHPETGYEPDIERMVDFLAPVEIKEIESIVTKYIHAYQHVPYRAELRSCNNADRPGAHVVEMFGTLISRFGFYSRLMPDFSSLPFPDQSNLLKSGVLEMCVLRGALTFDPLNNRWPNTNMSMYKDAPSLKLGNITHLTSNRVFQMHMDFISCIQQMGVDEPTIMLLVLIVLFTPERTGLIRPKWVETYQAYYISLLERYMGWRFGMPRSKMMFCKLLTKLSDLRELSESHNGQNLKLESDEIASIQNQILHLRINPFPECKVMFDDSSKPAVVEESANIHNPINNSAHCCYATPPNAQLLPLREPSDSRKNYLPQQSVPPTHQPNQEQPYYPNTEKMNPANFSYPAEQPCYGNASSSCNANGGMQQCYREQPQAPNMALQFMKDVQQSISRVVDAPYFGFEQVSPDYQFDPPEDDDDVVETPNTSMSQTRAAAVLATASNLENDCEKSYNPTNNEVTATQSTTLSPRTMEAFYEDLEKYSETLDYENNS